MKNTLILILFCLFTSYSSALTVVKLTLPRNCNEIIVKINKQSIDQNNKLEIFPNPNSGNFTVVVTFKSKIDKATINIYDLSGKSIFSETVFSKSNKLVKKFNITNLLPGSYILDIVNTQEESSTTLLIKK